MCTPTHTQPTTTVRHIHCALFNLEHITTNYCSSSSSNKATTGKWVTRTSEHSRCMLARGLRVTRDFLYLACITFRSCDKSRCPAETWQKANKKRPQNTFYINYIIILVEIIPKILIDNPILNILVTSCNAVLFPVPKTIDVSVCFRKSWDQL